MQEFTPVPVEDRGICKLIGVFFDTLGTPEAPMEAFDWLREFAGDKPIVITETGYPAEPTENPIWPQMPGSPEKQMKYLETLFEVATRDRYGFVIVFLHRDYDQMWEGLKSTRPAWHVAWRDIGLFDGNGEPRPAWKLWKQFFSLEYDRGESMSPAGGRSVGIEN